eukprot:SAG11_NODE_35766_length_265_cov_0.620482_1_plen_24_part_10
MFALDVRSSEVVVVGSGIRKGTIV